MSTISLPGLVRFSAAWVVVPLADLVISEAFAWLILHTCLVHLGGAANTHHFDVIFMSWRTHCLVQLLLRRRPVRAALPGRRGHDVQCNRSTTDGVSAAS